MLFNKQIEYLNAIEQTLCSILETMGENHINKENAKKISVNVQLPTNQITLFVRHIFKAHTTKVEKN